MKEKAIQNKIVQYLKQQPNTWFFKTHGGMYQVAGIPDLILCYMGHFVALEIKRPGEKPTKLQEKVLKDIQEAGGISVVVHSLLDVKSVLDTLTKEG
ncbi:VRR-NUC domain-containing protein [Alkaliphilus oremlandii]|uniref:VRR-NUC domain protein n=1 Tax=Alkaliphilus oremlandii (strain OhILAs) TaxID=350688 RepID=A8MGB3_ALKOO|nr:VRR-NUC domain-containing protein [Alkaliphilus oremlandii]ABW18841.1 VRR-NUC domain protein [Alkaliphilus oremlandii OhILAs]